MTNPITEPTQSIQERLAREICFCDSCCACDDRNDCMEWRGRLNLLERLLAEMKLPSDETIEAGRNARVGLALHPNGVQSTWRAMIQHIRDGGK